MNRLGPKKKYACWLLGTGVYVTLSRRPQNVIPRYRPTQAAADGEHLDEGDIPPDTWFE